MCRRLASRKVNNAGNSHEENAPNEYEMPSGRNYSQHTYSTAHGQSKANAPVTSTSDTQPVVVTAAADNDRTEQSASPPISSDDYLTPIDNYRFI